MNKIQLKKHILLLKCGFTLRLPNLIATSYKLAAAEGFNRFNNPGAT